jgi:TPR repeat protein
MKSLADIELKAHSAWDHGRHKQALQLFQRGAHAGLIGCMLDLGYFYDVGIGTRPDKAMAMHWYKRAYRKGDAAAASNIAVLYKEQGKSRLAFGWYARSAALWDGDSSLELAKLCLSGQGFRRSIPSAKKHLRAALSSRHITEASQVEAQELMRQLAPRAVSNNSFKPKPLRGSAQFRR